MAPLAIGLFGVVVGAVALFMSFSDSSKITALQSSVSDAAQAASDAKTEAASASGVSAKLDATSNKLDALVTNTQDVLTKYGQAITEDRAKLAELSDGMTKVGRGSSRGSGATASRGAPSAPGTHTIAAGDTFSTLARKYGVSVKAIEDANPGVDSSHLKIGQEISIPGSRSSSSSSSAPAPAPDAAPAPAPEPAATMAAPASAVTTQ
jgi:LysM repeat protein